MVFSIAGFSMLVSTLLVVWSNKAASEARGAESGTNILYILFGALLLSLFWLSYEMGGALVFRFIQQLSSSYPAVPSSVWQSLNITFLLSLGILLTIIWYGKRQRTIDVVTASFVLAAMAFLIYYLFLNSRLAVNPSNYALSVFILSLAELLIWPAVATAITKVTSAKYLATAFAFTLFLPKIVSSSYSLVVNFIEINDNASVATAVGLCVGIAIGLGIYGYTRKKKDRVSSKV
jgi:hypothetical protein